jgi:hypothetical protein
MPRNWRSSCFTPTEGISTDPDHPRSGDVHRIIVKAVLLVHHFKICLMVSCLSGWWYTYPSEKYEFVSWDDYSPHMEK